MSKVEKAEKTAISPTRAEDYAEWYQQVIKGADLAESSAVRGCMVIKPWGWAIWENIQHGLDRMFKATGHKNAYFPLFIPKSYLEKEAEHVAGFAKECAVVTHHRLIAGPNGGLIPDPDSKLEEPLIVRPTSETIIGAAYAQWVTSYRDLPILINQWANVVRWEMRTRMFLRTTEFLWQEGHTAHATEEEARIETRKMLDVYGTFAHDYMATPVIKGAKTDSERFPGAVDTYCIEGMMQDKKALQSGTSHFLGQNFAKASGIKFQTKNETEEYAWTTSWGVSTRLIGSMIMTHSDDNGLVLPPRLAPAHVVLWPVFRGDDTKAAVLEAIEKLAAEIRETSVREWRMPIEVEVDLRDMRGGDKQWEWVKKGIPLRIEIGPRDVETKTAMVARRDKSPREKDSIAWGDLAARIPQLLVEIQQGLFDRALAFRDASTRAIDDPKELDRFFEKQGGGFALVHWDGTAETEAKFKDRHKATIRCIPEVPSPAPEWAAHLNLPGTCIITGRPSLRRVVVARSY